MPITQSDSNSPIVFSGQMKIYNSGTPIVGANEKVITHEDSNEPIAYSSQEVIQ